jgi:hypothetical protein
VAPLPGISHPTTIALGNYPNDHHYTQREIPLARKSLHWGGHWTGTPFTLPYGCLVPETVDGFLVCEKNISVSHMANGATRLQPMVMALGQAAGMAAALCVEHRCQPRSLSVRSLQNALLQDPQAPAALIPLFDLLPTDPQWYAVQQHLLDHPEAYPPSGYWYEPTPFSCPPSLVSPYGEEKPQQCSGLFQRLEKPKDQEYELVRDVTNDPDLLTLPAQFPLLTLNPSLHHTFRQLPHHTPITITGYWNAAGPWWLVTGLTVRSNEL